MIAGTEAAKKLPWMYDGLQKHCLLAAALGSGGAALTGIVVVIQPEPWYAASVVIPVVGMVLGNGLSAVGLGFRTFLSTVGDHPAPIALRLGLGASRIEAMHPAVVDAVLTAITPTINSLSVQGLRHRFDPFLPARFRQRRHPRAPARGPGRAAQQFVLLNGPLRWSSLFRLDGALGAVSTLGPTSGRGVGVDPRDDDRPGARRPRSAAGRAVPDHDPLPDCGGLARQHHHRDRAGGQHVRELRHYFGTNSRAFLQLCIIIPPTPFGMLYLLSAHARSMRIGACAPMSCQTPVRLVDHDGRLRLERLTRVTAGNAGGKAHGPVP